MPPSAKYNWRVTRQKFTREKAGEIYERMMARVLRFKISKSGRPECADIHSDELDTRVEIKARGDNNLFGLGITQLLSYGTKFPYSNTLYALVPYRSRRRIQANEKRPGWFSSRTTMISMLSRLKTDRERNMFWARNVEIAYLLDIEVIQTLEVLLGRQTGHFPGREEEETVVVGRTLLTKFFQDENLGESLEKLGLNQDEWAKAIYPIHVRFSVGGQRVTSRFTLITVLRNNLHVQIASRISSRTLSLA